MNLAYTLQCSHCGTLTTPSTTIKEEAEVELPKWELKDVSKGSTDTKDEPKEELEAAAEPIREKTNSDKKNKKNITLRRIKWPQLASTQENPENEL